ncbi:very short patch repair endonuclease [Rhizobium leguminosarum]|uniref:very short patch repair endonuclease n=1 Tax=Rhizobium leguminosarum TaxID=384 RepID=UPI003F9C3E4A
MADQLTPERRSWLMSRVGGKNTTPEMRVRKAAHALGYRFRLHRKELPGTPDLLFPKKRLALFVHGCFWHRHPNCKKASLPKSRPEYWHSKFAANVERDERVRVELQARGWKVGVIWECETKSDVELRQRLQAVLSSSGEDSSTDGEH